MTPPDVVAQLLDALRPDYSADYWADEVEVRIAAALESLSETDWAHLTHASAGEPPAARARLAAALRHAPSDRTTDLLATLLRASEPEVGAAATESLFEQYHFRLPDLSVREELRRHLRAATPDLHPRLERLLARAAD
jgi:hypothetical protein